MPSLKINAKSGAIYYQQVLIYLLFFRPEFLSPPESDRTNITKEARDKEIKENRQKEAKTKNKHTHTSRCKQNRDFILPPTPFNHLKLFLKSFFLSFQYYHVNKHRDAVLSC